MKYCKKCGTKLLPEAIFCPKCGTQTKETKKKEESKKIIKKVSPKNIKQERKEEIVETKHITQGVSKYIFYPILTILAVFSFFFII